MQIVSRGAVTWVAVLITWACTSCGGRGETTERPLRQPGHDSSHTAIASADAEESPLPAAETSHASETNVQSASPQNLLQNGDFREWPQEQRVPTGWSHGTADNAGGLLSTLDRFPRERAEDGCAVQQTWEKNDSIESLARAFGQTVSGLEPDTEYDLEVRAFNRSENSVGISAWEVEGYVAGEEYSGKPVKRLALNSVTLTPGNGFKVYRGRFKTGPCTVIRVATKNIGKNPVLPGTIIWDSWKLTPYVKEPPNLLLNGSFQNWTQDAALPTMWRLGGADGSDDGRYTFERYSGSDFEGGYALRQVWTAGHDVGTELERFGHLVAALKPDTTHRLRIRAKNASDTALLVSCRAISEYDPGVPLLGAMLNDAVVRITPSPKFESYSGEFPSGDTGMVLLTVRLEDPNAVGAEVVWDYWKVERSAGSIDSP